MFFPEPICGWGTNASCKNTHRFDSLPETTSDGPRFLQENLFDKWDWHGMKAPFLSQRFQLGLAINVGECRLIMDDGEIRPRIRKSLAVNPDEQFLGS